MRLPSYPLTRTLAVVTMGYVSYALARPQMISSGLDGQVSTEDAKRLTRTWFGRDFPVGAIALFAPAPVVPYTVALRLAADATDAAVLGTSTTGEARSKSLKVTGGWGALQAAAFLVDRALAR